jgi:3-oxoacyl-[acyl-carrier-protein] synthase-1
MNNKVYIVADSIISALDFGSQKNMEALYKGESGVRMIEDEQLYPEAFMGARLDSKQLNRCFGNVQM